MAQGIGGGVVELEGFGIEFKALIEVVGGDADIHQGARPEAGMLVDGEFFTGTHCFMEVHDLRLGIGQGIECLAQVWDIGSEALSLIHISEPTRPY